MEVWTIDGRYMNEKPSMDEPNQGWKYGRYMDEKPRMDEPNQE